MQSLLALTLQLVEAGTISLHDTSTSMPHAIRVVLMSCLAAGAHLAAPLLRHFCLQWLACVALAASYALDCNAACCFSNDMATVKPCMPWLSLCNEIIQR